MFMDEEKMPGSMPSDDDSDEMTDESEKESVTGDDDESE